MTCCEGSKSWRDVIKRGVKVRSFDAAPEGSLRRPACLAYAR
jgi:hypothetical protein